MKKIISVLLLLACIVLLSQLNKSGESNAINLSASLPNVQTSQIEHDSKTASSIENAFQQQLSDIDVEGSGRVIKVLADDQSGSRHQKFLLEIPSQQSILIAHNIDLAPRIENLQVGDTVYFKGEYQWNSKGGVIHWTHHDPQGKHIGGWLELNGKRYQ
jgi:hypothetical protein